MTCREFASFIMQYLSGELPESTRGAFEEHLALCPNCVRYLAQYRATLLAGKDAFDEPDAPVPVAVPDDLVTAILAARKPDGNA